MTRNGATPAGTAAFAARAQRRDVVPEHFGPVAEWTLSTLGMGTYLGAGDDETDEAYYEAIVASATDSVNHFDCAGSYRYQRSERVLGRALRELRGRGVARDEVVVATKCGYVPFDGEPPEDVPGYLRARFVSRSLFAAEDIASGSHVLTPSFLDDQLGQSLDNLGVESVDVFYLHNPEEQLAVGPAEFESRLRRAFETLESACEQGKIGYYGVATWNALRVLPDADGYLSLARLVELAREAGGEEHRMRFVQAPYNLAMTEGFTVPNQSIGDETHSLFQAAGNLALNVVGSASLAQGRLREGLPDWLSTLFKGFDTDAQRSLQFARSTPGLASALVGMKSAAHVEENLALARRPPVGVEDFLKLFEVAGDG